MCLVMRQYKQQHRYHHAVLQDQLHHVLLELSKERLAGVLHQGHCQLQYPCHIAQ